MYKNNILTPEYIIIRFNEKVARVYLFFYGKWGFLLHRIMGGNLQECGVVN